MTINKQELKNKILYRSSYRGSKEMDIFIRSFVTSIIDDLDFKELNELNEFVNLDDETLKKIKSGSSNLNIIKNKSLIEKFLKFEF